MKRSTVDPDVRHDITDVLVRYATGIDSRDWSLFRSCFTDDCEADYGPIGAWHSADAITAWMKEAHEPCGHTLHRITNVGIEPLGEGIAVRSYVDAIVMGPDNTSGTNAIGFYDDVFRHVEDGWKIARRRFTAVAILMGLESLLLGRGGV
jgi:3-phenylpropionate/cinnamic acid dioxygenase small subunit